MELSNENITLGNLTNEITVRNEELFEKIQTKSE